MANTRTTTKKCTATDKVRSSLVEVHRSSLVVEPTTMLRMVPRP